MIAVHNMILVMVENLSRGRAGKLGMSLPFCGLAVGLIVPLVLAASPAWAQEVIEIGSDRTCEQCSIEFKRVATLGSLGDPVSPTLIARVAVDSRGRFFVAPLFDPAVVAMYSEHGEFVKTVGRRGEGPGEFKTIMRAAVGPGDSVHVFEAGGRYSLFTPAMDTFVALRRMPFLVQDVSFLPDGRFVANAMPSRVIPTKEPLHLVTSEGAITRSFGIGDLDAVGPEQIEAAVRRLGEAASGRIWAAHIIRYHVELWAPDGTHHLTLVRVADWYPPRTGEYGGSPFETKPEPRISALWEDGEERLWVVTVVSDRDWKPTRTRRRVFALHPDSPVSARFFFFGDVNAERPPQ